MNLNISVEFWHGESDEVKETHKNELITNAIYEVLEKQKEGYVAGDVNYEIDDIKYSGYWKLKVKE
jgi:hypothetical protein